MKVWSSLMGMLVGWMEARFDCCGMRGDVRSEQGQAYVVYGAAVAMAR